MIVVIHQTVDMAKPVKALRHFLKNRQKQIVVIMGMENASPLITTGGNVINGSAVFYA